MRPSLLTGMLAVLLACLAGPAAAQHPLAGLPLDDPAYVQLDGLVQLGCGAARVSAFRPFMVKDIQAALHAAASEPACAGRILNQLTARFLLHPPVADSTASRLRLGAAVTLRATGLTGGTIDPLWQDVRPTSQGDPPLVGLGRVRVTWNGGPDVLLVSEAYGETQFRNDPTVRAKPFRSTSGIIDFSDAYASGRLGRVVLSIGRAREAWLGDGLESLVLSANGPALDRITLTAQWTHFEFKALLASINDVVLTTATDSLADSGLTQRWHRMLIGHALTWRPNRQLEFTIGETGVIPRQGGGVNLQYANPLMIYQVVQNDRGRPTETAGNANLSAFGSVRANVGRASLQGDLLIDDIQIDSRDRKVFPDLLGWNVRATYALPLIVPTSIGFQYRRVGAYTYFGRSYTDTWQQYDQPIGSELGPDADLARVFAQFWTLPKLQLSGGVSRWRHGALRIAQRPPPDRMGHAGDPFPDTTADQPAVQGAWLFDASAQWLDGTIPVTASVELGRIDNVNNQHAPAATYGQFRLTGTWRFRYP